MSIADLTQLVTSTPLLTDAERGYWLEHLPAMKPNQQARLEQILTQGDDEPFAGLIMNFLNGLAGTKA